MRPGRPIRRTAIGRRKEYLRHYRPLVRRGRPRFKNRRDPAFIRWVRRQPCIITGLRTGSIWKDTRSRRRIARIHPCHIESRGAGGYDRGNVVSMQAWLHREQHRIGILTFQAKYGIDLKARAVELAQRYEMEHPEALAA